MGRFLIIGHKGTLGTAFTKLLPTEQIITVDRDSLDITNKQQIEAFFAKHRPEIVINCAAYTNVDGAEAEYESAYMINANAVGYLSEACNNIKARLIHYSTGMVFPGTNQNGYNEDSETNPVNKYGETKLAGEKLIQNTAQNYYIIRTEWLYGKPASGTAKKSFVELMIELGKSGKVRGVVDEIGKPTWTNDLAKATLELLRDDNPSGVYHLTNEGEASRLDWATAIYKIKNMAVEIEPVSGSSFPRPANRPEFELLNNTKLPQLRSWQEALIEYLQS